MTNQTLLLKEVERLQENVSMNGFWTSTTPEEIDKMLQDKNDQDKDAMEYIAHYLARELG